MNLIIGITCIPIGIILLLQSVKAFERNKGSRMFVNPIVFGLILIIIGIAIILKHFKLLA